MAVIRRLSTAVMIALLLFIALFPVLWTLLGSFKTLKDIVTPVPVIVFTPTLGNYVTVLATPAVQLGLMNSVIVVGGALGIGMLLGIPAAHALARHVVRFKADALFYVLSLRFMPPVAIAIPFIALYLKLGINDTRFSLILTYCLTTISTIIWLGVPAFEQVPREIEEAAGLEGYSDFRGLLARVAAGRASVARGRRALHLHHHLERASHRAGPHVAELHAAGRGRELHDARHGGAVGRHQRLHHPARHSAVPVHRRDHAVREPLLPPR